MADKMKWPFGAADVQAPAYAAAIAVTIYNMFTILNLAQLTGDATLNLTLDAQLDKGAILQLVVPASTSGFDLTMGAGIDGPDIVGVAGKTKTQAFVFDGTRFVPTGLSVQID